MESFGTVEVERPVAVEIERREPQERRPSALRTSGMVGTGLLLLGAAALLGRHMGRRVMRPRDVASRTGRLAGDLGRGFLAGMAGTLAITTASTVDSLVTEAIRARRQGRKGSYNLGNAIVGPWSFSAGAVSKTFGIIPTDPSHERRLSVMTHWEYGSTWGLALPLIHRAGLCGFPAMATILAGQLTAEMVVMPSFKLFPPPTKWGTNAVVSSIYQHAIYAFAAETAYDWLSPRRWQMR